MFQCIIQQRNGWIHASSPDMRDVFPDIRLQLNEQLRCLDVRVESQVSFIQELQDFFRRRGELELDYSKSLDKLAKTLQMRHKEQKQKREQWPLFSSYACWQQLLNQTKSLSKDHATLSEIYSVHLVAKLQAIIEDVQRIYKRCREIGYETHEEILRILQELHTTMKTYHSYQADCKVAETKLRTAEAQRSKLEQSIQKEKLERSKKYRLTKNEVLKRKSKYTDARLKALKAKNEYQLCLEAANTTIHKYFVEDLSDLIDCMDLGFGSMISRTILMHVTADQGRCRAVLQNADVLSHIIQSMDSRADKQKFLEQHHGAFMIPKRIEFQGQVEEEIEPELQKTLHADMEQRLNLLNQRLSNLRAESEEIWKTLETAEITLLDRLNAEDYDKSGCFGDGTHASQQTSVKMPDMTNKSKAEKKEFEEFYITKIREYILGTSRIARLDAKAELIRNALRKDSRELNDQIAKSNVPKRKRIGRINMSGQPKLFGGSLEEYLEATNEEIPLIMRSCIRVINLYGLHHQGIFRVSGSQVEISNFREGFERGEDPLADTTDASDINSVAGVLKLYLRELREPLFPIIYFDHFVSLAQLKFKHEIVMGIKKFLQSLPRAVVIVIRYLFAFLHHLSEYSDENMMDAYNLAICFGPTLMPAPEDKDQVQYQNQVNELIKNMITYHAELFPEDLGGLQYEKYISDEPFLDIDVGDSPSDHDQVVEDADSEVYPSEDESDILEAIVQFDFKARSNRELSLRKGDTVILRKQVSNDWWQGTIDGKEGLVPDKYISLKIKGEDHVKCSSSEESVRKRRPSGNIQVGNQLSIAKQPIVVHQQQLLGGNETSVVLTNTNINDTHHQHQHQQQQLIQQQSHHQQQQQQQQQQLQQYHLHHHGNEIHKSPSMVLLEDNNLCGSACSSGSSGGSSNNSAPPHSTNLNSVSKLSTEDLLSEKFHQNTINNIVIPNNNNDKESTSSSTSIDGNCSSIPPKYSYHDEIHSFENSMEFSEELSHFPFEGRKTSNEPIYAEPNKVPQPIKKDSSEDQDQVEIRFSECERPIFPQCRRSENVNMLHGSGGDKSPSSSEQMKLNRHSADSNLGCSSTSGSSSSSSSSNSSNSSNNPNKDNNRNLFRLNRDLWEKRAENSLQGGSFTQSRILERTRDAPDLVMDLPLSDHKNAATRNSIDCLDMELLDELTSAERFASQNQCTLKKNERFSTSTDSSLHKSEEKLDTKILEKPKAKVKPQQAESLDTALIGPESIPGGGGGANLKPTATAIVEKIKHLEEVLHIDEGNAETSLFGPKELIQKSPIPTRNTQKYVSQFADLKLTGGCQPDASTAGPSSLGGGVNTPKSAAPTTPEPLQLSSFKPQVKVKPQILKKTFIRTPTTPEAKRKNMDID